MNEMYAHELEGQTVIIETVRGTNGKRKPFGFMLQVRLEESGLVVPNVSSINISMPLVPNALITAEITLAHINPRLGSTLLDDVTYETVTVQNPKLSIAAEVEKEQYD